MGEEGVLNNVFASACRSSICSARPSLAWKAMRHRVNTCVDQFDNDAWYLTNVAMHQPSARVVRLESYYHKAIHGQENDVSARGVVQCQIEPVWRVLLGGLLKDRKVMAVEVDLQHLSANFQGLGSG